MRFGYHVSVSGPPVSAIVNGVDEGCETIQMFPGPPQQWQITEVSDDDALEFRQAKEGARIDPAFIHSIYLVNMAAPSSPIYKRSITALVSAMEKAEKLGAAAVITHIGNHKGEGAEWGLERIASAVKEIFTRFEGSAMLLLETTAGAGTSIGNTFEQFGRVFDLAGRPQRLGLCVDTCHVFVAGYDIRTPEGIDSTLDEIDRFIGLDRLRAFHLNDSAGLLGSNTDRHAHIGKGELGLEAFRYIVNDERVRGVPAIIELPHGQMEPEDDLALLRSLVNAK